MNEGEGSLSPSFFILKNVEGNKKTTAWLFLGMSTSYSLGNEKILVILLGIGRIFLLKNFC